MKVKELIEQLEKLDQNLLVVISRDEEGNGFTDLSSDFQICNYCNHEIGLPRLTKSLKEQGYSEDDVLKGQPAIVLYPNNFYN